ncbi:indolepyruvate ferredoxin oxidoreductase subunit alpha [Eggerthella sinensis]|uniref:indolepyruvate ferredoxin oxidoreductase subunit alpha n=1 Tax=Eggerthella sinensis TaxID=242230 RepID=UPI002FD80D61
MQGAGGHARELRTRPRGRVAHDGSTRRTAEQPGRDGRYGTGAAYGRYRCGVLPAVSARGARRGLRHDGRGGSAGGAHHRRDDGGGRPAVLRRGARQGVLRRRHAHALRGHRGAVDRLPHVPAARRGGAPRRRGGAASARRPHLRAQPVHAGALSRRLALRAGGVLPAGRAGRVLRPERHAHRARALRAGQRARAVAGFVITDRCVGCGTCAEVCPEQCIVAGSPYEIAQVHCLRCGRCAEVCPHDAIERRS